MQDAVVKQMRAALAMLRRTMESFPDELWLAGEPNRSWRIAYHALYFTDLYLARDEGSFVAWERHRAGLERFKDAAEPYAKDELLEYCDRLSAEVEARVRMVAPEAASGFSWLAMTRLEAHLYNLRHLAHHGGQLADRLRGGAGVAVAWVRRGE